MSTSSLTEVGFGRADFERFIAQRNQEPDWLIALRRDWFSRFEAMDWPDRRSEEWMRSDLRLFKLHQYRLPQPESAPVSVPQRLQQDLHAAGELLTLDGQQQHLSLADDVRKSGVIFCSLEHAAAEHPELVQQHLFSTVDPGQDRFAALHAATMCGGHFLYVPRGVRVPEPLYVLAGMSDGGVDLGHTLIVLEDGAEATFLYEASSPHELAGGFHCGAVEIIVKSRAALRYVNLQDWGRQVWHFAHQNARVGQDASLQWTVAALGSRFAQVNQQVSLVGRGANSQVNGVLFTQDKQQLTYNTLQHHRAASCRSDFLYKSALQDRSRTVWRGMIKVDPDAQQTDGYQRNDNLMLSDRARADSIPGLEIEADEVRCTHGSTTSKVDEELIFYARSRGFTRGEATRMIVTGFFQQIFDRITIDSVRDALGAAIARQVRQYD